MKKRITWLVLSCLIVAALLLASDEASFITGHGLSVDGGAAA